MAKFNMEHKNCPSPTGKILFQTENCGDEFARASQTENVVEQPSLRGATRGSRTSRIGLSPKRCQWSDYSIHRGLHLITPTTNQYSWWCTLRKFVTQLWHSLSFSMNLPEAIPVLGMICGMNPWVYPVYKPSVNITIHASLLLNRKTMRTMHSN